MLLLDSAGGVTAAAPRIADELQPSLRFGSPNGRCLASRDLRAAFLLCRERRDVARCVQPTPRARRSLPRLPAALLRALLPRAERDEVLADIAVEFDQHAAAHG